VPLVGDPAKAMRQLGWRQRTTFEEMIAAMVEADLRQLAEERDRGGRRAEPLG
jgi:GDPmannose 4,6-dehydratase